MPNQKPLPADEAASRGEEAEVGYWLGEIQLALKREKSYRQEAKELVEIFEGERDTPYNILYSNTETLSPAIYTQPPRPDTRPKTRNPGPIENAAAGLVDAYLTQFIDSGDSRYCSFDTSLRESLIHALVPGRGVQRFHYRADVEYGEDQTPRRVKDELVYAELVDWDKILFGYAKTWKGVPWVAFIHDFTREEATAELGAEAANKLTYTERDEADGEKKENRGAVPTARVFEIWDKARRRVLFVSEGCKTWVKKPAADPYKLANFYPIQEPLYFFCSIRAFLPVPLYRLYKQQASELNRITRRITALIDGMKVRGAYDAGVEELKKIMEADDNELVPLQNSARLGDGADLSKAIYLVPIEQHIQVLVQLIQQRQAIKMVIFEIMGIADIMRGSSVASETLGAQKIKSQWGTLRLKTAQSRMASYVREGLRLAAELAFSKLAPDTLRAMTGSTLPPLAQKQQAQAAIQQAQMLGQEPPPELQQLALMPAFEECIELLKSDIHRKYAIDIETNSTIDAEATEDKESVAEFMNAFSQFLSGVGPLIQEGVLPFEAAQGMMLAISRRFRLGRDLEEHLKKMQPPQGGGDNGEAQKAALEAEMKTMQGQMAIQKDRMKLEQDRMKFQIEQAKAQAQQILSAIKQQIQDEKAKMALERLLMQIEMAMDKMAMAGQQQSMELDMQGQQLQMQGRQQEMAAQQREAQFATKQTVATERQKQQAAKMKAQQQAQPKPKGGK